MEEVVVTAQKREENLQDVPLSVQAFTGDQLDAKGINDAKQLQQTTPGLSYGNMAGYSLIYLRGVGNDVFVPGGDASVATYVDGLYFSFLGGLGQSLGNIERLEILKGPQGTLFGRNSTGGAINVVTKDPSQVFEGDAHVSYGSFDAVRTKAYVSGPIVDTLSASLGVIYNRQESYMTHTDPENYGGGSHGLQPFKDRGARLKILWEPTENFTAKLTGYALKNSGSQSLLVAESIKPIGAAVGAHVTPDPYKTDVNLAVGNNGRNYISALDLVYELDGITIKTITGYQDIKYRAQADYDGSSANFVGFDTPTFDQNFSQELQVLSNPGGAFSELFGNPLSWIVGGYYFRDETGFSPNDFTATNLGDVFENVPLLRDVPLFSSSDNLQGRSLAELLTGSNPTAIIRFYGILGTESYAGFTQATYNVTDWMRFTAGARAQHEERRNINSSTFLRTMTLPDVPVTNFPERTISSSNISPKFVLDVKPNDDTLLYVNWSKGFKSGTLNTVALLIPPQAVKPEVLTAVEAGAKMEFLNGKLRLNSAVFQNDVKNGHVFFISIISGGVANLENAGSYRIRGADFDVTWQPGEHWLLSGGAAYLDGNYQDYVGSGYNEQTGVLQQNIDFGGNQTVRTPTLTGNLSGSFFFQALSGQWEMTVDAYHSDRYYFDAQNTIPQKAYELVNARVSYLYEPWSLRATLFGRNLNDALYSNNKFGSDFGVLRNVASPREIGLQLDWNF